MIKTFIVLVALGLLAMPVSHPFGPVRAQHSDASPPAVPRAMERACLDCHSQRTKWPLYSYLPLLSWGVERDVAEARQHLDFSRWSRYSKEDKRDLLARTAAEVRNHRMPLSRYTLLHPEARLSEEDIQSIYEWTKAERHKTRE